jgi:hypothetical protein
VLLHVPHARRYKEKIRRRARLVAYMYVLTCTATSILYRVLAIEFFTQHFYGRASAGPSFSFSRVVLRLSLRCVEFDSRVCPVRG